MGTNQDFLSQVCWAQTLNSTLANEDLREAAELLVDVAAGKAWQMMPVDEAGGRLIGAALVTRGDLSLVDASRRLDEQRVLLVTGHLAGAVGVALKATLVHALGATRVDAAVLGGWAEDILGCERVWDITPREGLPQRK